MTDGRSRAVSASVPSAPRSRRRRRPLRGHLWSIPYLIPAFALIGFVFGYPVLRVLDYSVQSRPNMPGSALTTLNYRLSVDDPSFWDAIGHNLTFLLAVPVLTVLALLAAILVFHAGRASQVYRSALFLPCVLSIPVVGVTWGTIYSLHGPINGVFRSIGLSSLAHDWLGDPAYALGAVLTVIIWKEFGFGLLLFSARMASIESDLYDAARVDGAGWWAQHRHVTVPALGRVIEFFVVVEAITMLSFVFGYVYTMTHGGPGDATIVMEFLIWSQGFAASNLGLASATAVLLLGGTLLLLIAQAVLRSVLLRARR
jgi:ABC-type sugar transport system permease subunit